MGTSLKPQLSRPTYPPSNPPPPCTYGCGRCRLLLLWWWLRVRIMGRGCGNDCSHGARILCGKQRSGNDLWEFWTEGVFSAWRCRIADPTGTEGRVQRNGPNAPGIVWSRIRGPTEPFTPQAESGAGTRPAYSVHLCCTGYTFLGGGCTPLHTFFLQGAHRCTPRGGRGAGAAIAPRVRPRGGHESGTESTHKQTL